MPTAAMPTLTKKMLRQPIASVSKPPTVGPIARPTEAMPVQMPIALALAFGSGKAALTSASDATLTMAAPTPWRARPMFSTSSVGASPQRADAPANSTMPAMKTRRRPRWSASVAADMMNMPIVRL